MSTAAGDLVATLALDASQFAASAGNAQTTLMNLNGTVQSHQAVVEQANGSITGAYRSFSFLGREIEHAGGALSNVNETLGGGVAVLGEAVAGVGMVTHGWHAAEIAIKSTTAAQIAFNLASPVGLLWAGVAVLGSAGAAWYYYITSVSEATVAQEKFNEAKREELRLGEEKTNAPTVLPLSFKEQRSLQDESSTSLIRKQREVEEEVRRTAQAYQDAKRVEDASINKPGITNRELMAIGDVTQNAQREQTNALLKQSQIETALATAKVREHNQALIDIVARLKEHGETIGMDASALAHHQGVQAGANAAQLRAIDAWAAHNKKIQEHADVVKEAQAAQQRATSAFDAEAASLKNKILALQGFSADQIKLFDLENMGVASDKIEMLRKKMAPIQGMELTKGIDDYNKSLRETIATFGMSDWQKKIYELQQARTNPERLAETARLGKQLDALRAKQGKPETQETPKAAEYGSEDAFKEILRLTGQSPEADATIETADNTRRIAELLAAQNALTDNGMDDDFDFS